LKPSPGVLAWQAYAHCQDRGDDVAFAQTLGHQVAWALFNADDDLANHACAKAQLPRIGLTTLDLPHHHNLLNYDE
jgi:hypothetical protein